MLSCVDQFCRVRADPRVLEWMSEQSGEELMEDVDDELEFWADL